MLIFETENFTIEAHDRPFVDRFEGGHIVIRPKIAVEDRTKLSPSLAKELMKLTIVVGTAFPAVMKKSGVEIGRINYMDLGNWGPTLHVHIIGRAKTATMQKYGEALQLPKRETGFYDTFKPLTEQEVEEFKNKIMELLQSEKFQNF